MVTIKHEYSFYDSETYVEMLEEPGKENVWAAIERLEQLDFIMTAYVICGQHQLSGLRNDNHVFYNLRVLGFVIDGHRI